METYEFKRVATRVMENHSVVIPEGMKVVTFNSSYYGSKEEYGEGDREYTFAVPLDCDVKLNLSHGHCCGNLEEQVAKLPVGSLALEEFYDEPKFRFISLTEVLAG